MSQAMTQTDESARNYATDEVDDGSCPCHRYSPGATFVQEREDETELFVIDSVRDEERICKLCRRRVVVTRIPTGWVLGR